MYDSFPLSRILQNECLQFEIALETTSTVQKNIHGIDKSVI